MTKRTSIMVQPPTATDLWQIADLWAEMQAELSRSTDAIVEADSPLATQKATYEQQLREWYRDPAVFILVGVRTMGDEQAGQVVAFMISRIEDTQPRHGRLIDLYVQPSLRGNNLAQHMVEAASGWMRAQKCEFLEASTLTSNRAGMAFLASTQFQLHSSVLRKKL